MLSLTRRTFASLPFAAALRAQQAGYPGVWHREYSECLPNHLRRLAREAYEKRNAELARLTTRDAVAARQKWVAKAFWKIAGVTPERTPLNVRTMGGFDRSGYRVEKLVYESRPGLFVTADLYIPTNVAPPFPGVLFQMGHSTNGKAAEPYQKCMQGLARLGFLVLGFDPIGQGERIYYPDGKGGSRVGGATGEHTHIGRQQLLIGDTATAWMTWDAVRSLDVLASHPMVDAKRLASTGQSGGGTLTQFLCAVDDRLAAAVVSSGNTENFACKDFNPPGSTDDAEQDFVYSGPEGFDRWDTLWPLAPKPLKVLVSARDFFGTYSPRYLSSGWEEYGKLQRVYQLFGASAKLEWGDTPLPHALGYQMRMHVYRFLVKWLMPGAKPVHEEPPVTPEKDETLWAVPSGNVKALGGKSPFDFTVAEAAQIKAPAHLNGVRAALRYTPPPAQVKVLARGQGEGCETASIEVSSAPEIWVPAYGFVPRKPAPGNSALLICDTSGRQGHATDNALGQELARSGRYALFPDLSAIGDMAGESPRGQERQARRKAEEEAWAWAFLILGRTLLGQRVADIVASVKAMRALDATRPITVVARERLASAALFAALLEPAISNLVLYRPLLSYRHVVETEMYSTPLSELVPNMLRNGDLPQVAAAVAPRHILLAAVRETANTRKLYPGKHVEFRDGVRWDAALFNSLA